MGHTDDEYRQMRKYWLYIELQMLKKTFKNNHAMFSFKNFSQIAEFCYFAEVSSL